MIAVIRVAGFGVSNRTSSRLALRLTRFNSTTTTTTSSSASAGKTTSTESSSNNSNDFQTNSGASKQSCDFYDVVVCGGGMVGTAMVAALGNQSAFKNMRIALIESAPKGE